MKKSKLLPLLIAMTMSAQIFSGGITLVKADADSVPVDYRHNFTDTSSLSDITGLTVSGDGTAEIVTEEDGNTALRAAGEKTLKFTSDITTASEVEVSYKMKVIASANVGYGDKVLWGAVRNSSVQAVRAIHYYDNINFFTGGSNTDEFDMVAAVGDGKYHSIKYVLDFEEHIYKLYIDGVYTKEWNGRDWNFYDTSVNNINNIYFALKATDEVYFDDIVIKDIIPPTSWNFEESKTVSDYSGVTVSGNTSIVDDGAGNNYLKAEENSSVTFTFPKTTSGRVMVKFKLKSDAELAETGYEQGDFGAMYNDSTLVIRSTLSNGKGMTQYPITGANVDNPGARRQKITTAGSDAFKEICYDIDFAAQSYVPTVDGALIEHWGYRHFEVLSNQSSVTTLKFTPRSNVIYLDDIEIVEYQAEASEWTFEDDTELPSEGCYAMGNNTSIVTEDDGNKALYISGPTTIRFRSPSTTTQKAVVQYKVKVESAASNFTTTSWQFGAVNNDTSTAIHTARYKTNGILGWKGTGNTNRTLFGFNSAAGDGQYHTVKYVLDFESHTYSAYVDGKLNDELSNAAFRDATVNDINNLYFYVQSGDKFYLDDVSIKEMKPAGEWDFEASAVISDYDGLTLSGTTEIVKDADAASNVLKVTGGSTVRFDVSATVSNKVEVRYKLKGELESQSGIYNFGAVRSGSSEAVKVAKWTDYILNYNGSGNNKILTLSELKAWKDIKIVIDMDNHTYRTWVDGVLKPYHENAQNYDKKFYNNTLSSIDNVYFDVQSGNTVYIDDVSIKDITLNAIESEITGVDPTGAITVKLDNAVAYKSVNNGNFELYAGETEITDFAVKQTDAGVLEFTLPNGFAYDTVYMLKVLNSINTDTSGFARTAEDIVITAETITMPEVAPEIKSTYPADGAEVGLVNPVIKFTNPLAAESVDVTVTDENGTEISDITILGSDTNSAFPTATISIPDMAYGKTYTVEVNNVNGAGVSALEMTMPKSFSFKTSELTADNVTVVTNGTENNNIKASAILKNNTNELVPYVFCAALYKDGILNSVDIAEGDISANNEDLVSAYLTKPDDFGEEYTVRVFAWSNLTELKPYMQDKAIVENVPCDDTAYWTEEDLSVWKSSYDEKITNKGIDGFKIGVITDVQTDAVSGFGSLLHHYGLLVKSANLIGGVDCVTDLGDMISGYNANKPGLLYKMAKQSSIMMEAGVPVFRVIGNHDDNQGGVLAAKSNNSYISPDDWTEACDADWANVMEGSTAGNKPYYYKDFAEDKIRVITLNTSDVPWEYTGQTSVYFSFGLGQKQLEWLANEALDFSAKGDDKSDWGVVFVMHVGVSDGNGIYNYSALTTIINAFREGTSGIINKTNSRGDMSIYGLEYDFTEQGKMEIICTLDGHTHKDSSKTWNDMLKITTISSNRVNGTKEDIGTDIITIDRSNRKIYATRLGKGNDREWEY